MIGQQAVILLGQMLQPINVLTQQGKLTEAERELSRIASDLPERLSAITIKAMGDADSYNPLESLKLLDIAYRMVGVLYNNLGNGFYDRYEQSGNKSLLDDSLRCHQKGQANGNLAPGAPYGDSNHIFVTALFGLGRATWALGQPSESRTHLRACLTIKLDPDAAPTPNQQMANAIQQQARTLLQKVEAPTPPSRATPASSSAPTRPAVPSVPTRPAPTRKRANLGTLFSMLVIAIVLGLILAGMGLINLNGWRPMGLQDSAPAFAHAQFYRGRSHF